MSKPFLPSSWCGMSSVWRGDGGAITSPHTAHPTPKSPAERLVAKPTPTKINCTSKVAVVIYAKET
ncbi:MAG: hypothetical protein E6I91_17115 [Chloroflexi bacterium]|nr:MAG: hypothetical protein E6I91_17115 [Chloroflexota bacterium]